MFFFTYARVRRRICTAGSAFFFLCGYCFEAFDFIDRQTSDASELLPMNNTYVFNFSPSIFRQRVAFDWFSFASRHQTQTTPAVRSSMNFPLLVIIELCFNATSLETNIQSEYLMPTASFLLHALTRVCRTYLFSDRNVLVASFFDCVGTHGSRVDGSTTFRRKGAICVAALIAHQMTQCIIYIPH